MSVAGDPIIVLYVVPAVGTRVTDDVSAEAGTAPSKLAPRPMARLTAKLRLVNDFDICLFLSWFTPLVSMKLEK